MIALHVELLETLRVIGGDCADGIERAVGIAQQHRAQRRSTAGFTAGERRRDHAEPRAAARSVSSGHTSSLLNTSAAGRSASSAAAESAAVDNGEIVEKSAPMRAANFSALGEKCRRFADPGAARAGVRSPAALAGPH